MKLEELKVRATRDLPIVQDLKAGRRSLPENVLSASIWEIPTTLTSGNGVNRIAGSEPINAWEQALFRILPSEILKRVGTSPGHFVLPLRGSATEANSETLRLGLFYEARPGKPVRVSALAFRPIALLQGESGTGLKRFLIDDGGLILAHPRISETGIRTSSLAELFRKAEAKNSGSGESLRVASRSWEGFPTTMRFERIPGWNAFLVIERVHAPLKAGFGANPIIDLGLICGGLVSILLIYLGLGYGPKFSLPRRKRSVRPAAVNANESVNAPFARTSVQNLPVIPASAIPHASVPRTGIRELRANPPPFVPKTPITSLGNGRVTPVFRVEASEVDSELARFLHARTSRSEGHVEQRLTRERILLEEFVAGKGDIETRLVESCSKATKSPALFFRYDTLQGIARLTAEAGYPASQSIIGAGGMSFSLPTSLIAEIHSDDAKAKRTNLWDHAPLSRLMLSRLGIANFEAWPMIHRIPSSQGPSRFLGVLVIAESGVDSVMHREFLGALLERASRVFA